MKRALYILTALMLLVSCDGNNGPLGPDIDNPGGTENPGGTDNPGGTGNPGGTDNPGEQTLEQLICAEWKSSQLPVDGEIYLDLKTDKTFTLYQQIGDGNHRIYRGTWNLEENILSGKYNDGESWNSSYAVTLEKDTMTLTSSENEVSVYTKTTIPDQVKENSTVIVKSSF